MEQVICHLDMDCFFAAVEERENPVLHHYPLIIGGYPSKKRGVVTTCNYEARKFGVRSAMPVLEAKRRCPHGMFMHGRFSLYREVSRQIMDVIRGFGVRVEIASVDEAYLDISAFVNQFGSYRACGEFIAKSIWDAVSLTCSVGIAHSRYVAKIASDYEKPKGITVVADAATFLKDLDVGVISGVGKKAQGRLKEKGINTVGDLATLSDSQAFSMLGKWSGYLQRVARGLDKSGLRTYGERKSQSLERTFFNDIEKEKGYGVLMDLCKKLDVRSRKFAFKTVSIKVRYSDFTTVTRSKSLLVGMKDEKVLKQFVWELYEGVAEKKIRLLGVRVSNLEYGGEQKRLDV